MCINYCGQENNRSILNGVLIQTFSPLTVRNCDVLIAFTFLSMSDSVTVKSTLTCGGLKRMARCLIMGTSLLETLISHLKEYQGREA